MYSWGDDMSDWAKPGAYQFVIGERGASLSGGEGPGPIHGDLDQDGRSMETVMGGKGAGQLVV